jgi:hypothetical protein
MYDCHRPLISPCKQTAGGFLVADPSKESMLIARLVKMPVEKGLEFVKGYRFHAGIEIHMPGGTD